MTFMCNKCIGHLLNFRSPVGGVKRQEHCEIHKALLMNQET